MTKRVFLTGGFGFLGQHVHHQLESVGHTVIAVPHNRLDMLNAEDFRAHLKQYKPIDAVIHLAAKVGGIQANQRSPAVFMEDNLLMGVNALSVSYECGVPKYLLVGTVCGYPEVPPHIPFIEDDLWSGYPEPTNAPYGIAKRTLIALGQAYRAQYNYNAIAVIPTNLYGPGDNFDPKTSHVIPALIKKCLDAVDNGDDTLEVWGDGTATRDFLYAEDAARGIQLALDCYDDGEPVNLGSGVEVSIGTLIGAIARLTGYRGMWYFGTDRPNGQSRRVLDITRARERLGWTPATALEDGLRATVKWYRKQRGGV